MLSCSSNGDDADFCGDTQCRLIASIFSGAVFMSHSREKAQEVIDNQVMWYNSDHATPMISKSDREFAVVAEIKII